MFDSKLGIITLFSDTGVVVFFVLSVLLFFSIMSWGIIAFKFGYIRKSLKESHAFLDYFFEVYDVEKAFVKSKEYRSGSIPNIFRSCYSEYKALDGRYDIRHIRAKVALAVKREANAENKRVASLVPFLATVGNTAPFIGLFGTVWGIMTSFHTIGSTQSASLAAVAPGISEALIATAAGLAAAIPAVMGYNYLTQKIGVIERDIELFSPDVFDAFFNEP